MVSEYSWGQLSSCSVVVSLGLHLFNQAFWHTLGVAYQHVAIEVWLAELAGTLVAGTLGGARTFGSVVDCTALWLHCAFAATAGLAGVHDCSLGVIHWCATNLGGVTAGACNMYVFLGACIWLWSLLETSEVSVAEGGQGSCFVTTLSHRCFRVWGYTAPAVVHTRYVLCCSLHITVPGIHIPLEVSSIDTICPTNSGSRVCTFQSWVIVAWSDLIL